MGNRRGIGAMKTIIIHENLESDLKISIRRKGRKIIIVTDAPQVARAVKRQIVESMKTDEGEVVITGFGRD